MVTWILDFVLLLPLAQVNSKTKELAKLFEPPLDLMFQGSFDEVCLELSLLRVQVCVLCCVCYVVCVCDCVCAGVVHCALYLFYL